MATNSDAPIVIDPHFQAPPGVVNVIQGTLDARDSDLLATGADVLGSSLDTPVSNTPTQSGMPSAPTSFTIVSQTVRMSSDGTQLVDVVIDIPDQPGISSYEMRISKY